MLALPAEVVLANGVALVDPCAPPYVSNETIQLILQDELLNFILELNAVLGVVAMVMMVETILIPIMLI